MDEEEITVPEIPEEGTHDELAARCLHTLEAMYKRPGPSTTADSVRALCAAAIVLHEDLSALPTRATPSAPQEEPTAWNHLYAIAQHQAALLDLADSPLNFRVIISKDSHGYIGTVLGLPGCTLRAQSVDDVLRAAPQAIRSWLAALGRTDSSTDEQHTYTVVA